MMTGFLHMEQSRSGARVPVDCRAGTQSRNGLSLEQIENPNPTLHHDSDESCKCAMMPPDLAGLLVPDDRDVQLVAIEMARLRILGADQQELSNGVWIHGMR